MNVRTSKNLMLAAAVVCMLNFTSCSKYEDGPKISLLTKTARLTGEWEVIEVDGEDMPDDVTATFEFEKKGDFSVTTEYSGEYYSGDYTEKGEWTWNDGKESIELDWDDGGKEDYDILRLTNKELWVEDEDGVEVQMEKI